MPRKRTKKAAEETAPELQNGIARRLGQVALPAAPMSVSADDFDQINFDANAIMSFPELLAAISARKVQITLGNNIIATDNIVINHDVAINFNGFSIISDESRTAARVLDVRSGEVTLTGQGKIFAMGKNSVAIRAFGAISTGTPNYTIVTIDEGISLFAPDSYGILISPNLGVAYGLTINLAGKIFAHDGICLASGIRGYDPAMPVINIKSGAQIAADENSGMALEAAGYGKWNIGLAHLHGAVGASMASGILEFNNTQIVASSGECFRVLENLDALLEVNLNGGKYIATNNAVAAGVSATVKKFEAKNCDFCSPNTLDETWQKVIKQKKVNLRTDVQVAMTENAAPASQETATESELDQKPAASAPAMILPEKLEAKEANIEEETSIEAMEAEFEDILDAVEKPKKEKKARKTAARAKKTTRKSRKVKAEMLDLSSLPGLGDGATDEREILQELNGAEKEARPRPQAVLGPAPEPVIPFTSEQDAARRALTDAIADIRKLSAEDYDTGFSELERAIQWAERILTNPLASLAEICEAASALLAAFDDLEERDDANSISDEELDELFYHGAVLQEMLQETKKPKLHRKREKVQTYLPESPKSAFVAVPEVLSQVKTREQKTTNQNLENPNLAPNFSNLSAVLTRVSELDLNSYTASSQENLLKILAQAQAALTNPETSQAEVDDLAQKISIEIPRLVRLRQPYTGMNNYHTAVRQPAPTISSSLAPTMIDEMTPTAVWSLGVTMIDEMTPFVTDATTREKMLRMMKSRSEVLKAMILKPFQKFAKGITAGLRAGVRAYRETWRGV